MLRRLAFALLLATGTAAARGLETTGDYQVHYSAFASGFLTPEIAREYGILRSRTRGVLLVSVKRAGEPATPPTEAWVSAGSGQPEPLPLRAVRTDGTVSFLGSFAIADGESRRFRILVTPPDAAPLEITFSQQFFDER